MWSDYRGGKPASEMAPPAPLPSAAIRPAFGDPRLPDRFWSKVDVNDETGCWEWTAQIQSAGYGRYFTGARQEYSHRVSTEALREPIPVGMVIDHLCRVRACVNPAHLDVVEQRTNVLRGDAPSVTRARHAAQTHCKQGHELSGDNVTRGIRARCRTCQNAAALKSRRSRADIDPREGA